MDDRLLRRILPRVIKAAFWGFIMGGEALIVYYIPGFREMEAFLPMEPTYFSGTMILFVVFEVAIQLLAETVYQYALGAARAIVAMMLMVHVSNGGTLTQKITMGAGAMELTVGYKPVLVMFLVILLLVAFKNVLNAICLFQKGEESIIS